jgi:hypothetical protein
MKKRLQPALGTDYADATDFRLLLSRDRGSVF